MSRFIILGDAIKQNHRWHLLIFDKVKHYPYLEPLWKFRMKRDFYEKHGVEKEE